MLFLGGLYYLQAALRDSHAGAPASVPEEALQP
jgi:hypothetical protein